MPDRAEREWLSQALIELDTRIHSNLDFDEIMQSTLDAFVEALGADAGDIKLCADGAWEVRYQAGLGPQVVGVRLRDAEAPVAERVRRLGEPVAIDDFLTEPPEVRVGLPLRYRLRAGLAVPLVIRQNVEGCLFAWMRDTPRAFSSDEVDFARRVATSVSLALANARHFAAEHDARRRAEVAEAELERELARTRTLLRASDELLTTSDPDELLRRLADIVLDATSLKRIFINLIDMRERVLIPKIGSLQAPVGSVIPFQRLSETSRMAIARGKPAVLDYERAGTPEADRAIAQANNARLVLFVPLVYKGVVIGHISVDEPGERHSFSDEEIRIVASIASEASLALHNARIAAERAVELLEQQLRKMAYALHDGPLQTLATAGTMLEWASQKNELEAMRAEVAVMGGGHPRFRSQQGP
jgi:GAF domain-containing protein